MKTNKECLDFNNKKTKFFLSPKGFNRNTVTEDEIKHTENALLPIIREIQLTIVSNYHTTSEWPMSRALILPDVGEA